MTHPDETTEEMEPAVGRPTTQEVFARSTLAAVLLLAPVALLFLWFEPTCGQKVDEFRTEHRAASTEMGLTFSAGAAEWRGLDPLESLDHLLGMGFSIVRLATYMNQSTEEILSELAAQIALAEKHDASVVLAVGGKAPHYPEWYISPDAEREELQKAFAVIERFGNDPTVEYWQLSNEPFERSNGREKEHVLRAIHAKMREYDKPIVATHLIDLLLMDDGEFREAAAYADIIGLNDFLQVSFIRDSCARHVERYRHFRRLADELGVELWITESQTQPWPAQIPFTSIEVPEVLYDPFEPEEIPMLFAMQNMYVRPRVILHWEVLEALAEARSGNDRALRAIEQTLDMSEESPSQAAAGKLPPARTRASAAPARRSATASTR